MTDVAYFRRPNRPLQFYASLFLIVLYVPILFIPLFSFNSCNLRALSDRGIHNRTGTRNSANRDALWEALGNSLRVGLVVSIISTSLGVLAARAITRTACPGKVRSWPSSCCRSWFPGIIFGVALLVLISRLGIPLSLYTVTIGHLIVCLPFAISTLLPRFEGFDRSMEEASADLGENPWWTFWRVTFPIILPGVVASLLLTFTVSFDEFIMAFFLSGTDATLPMYIWSQLRFPQEFPSVLALSTVILVASFVLVFAGLWIGRLGAVEQVARSARR